MNQYVQIKARDPIVSRDGRPFGKGQGNRMRSTAWPMPSMVAGSLRTALGNAAQRSFSETTSQELLALEVAGVFPSVKGQLYLPAPRDCVASTQGPALRAEPRAIEDSGADWPVNGLLPVMLQGETPKEKPSAAPCWWPLSDYVKWLLGQGVGFDERFLLNPIPEERMHVSIDANTGAAQDEELFTTAALPLSQLRRYAASGNANPMSRMADIELALRLRAGGWAEEAARRLDALHPLGGERRLAHWQAAQEPEGWCLPSALLDAFASTKRVRMTLATPAIFSSGWKPGWLDDALVGIVPRTAVRVKLVGLSIDRWRAISGWSLAHPRGPKPVKRYVAAGGVYFFELIEEGSAAGLSSAWLEPMSDDAQDRRDGFGLATWGIW